MIGPLVVFTASLATGVLVAAILPSSPVFMGAELIVALVTAGIYLHGRSARWWA